MSGTGRYRILDMMGRLGSMHAAVRQLQMRYRVVWMRIRTSEERIGKPWVASKRKGLWLTAFAENLMKMTNIQKGV